MWEKECKASATELSDDRRDARFHVSYSSGTAAVRGTQAMTNCQYFWEIKMTTPVYGTDMVCGSGSFFSLLRFLPQSPLNNPQDMSIRHFIFYWNTDFLNTIWVSEKSNPVCNHKLDWPKLFTLLNNILTLFFLCQCIHSNSPHHSTYKKKHIYTWTEKVRKNTIFLKNMFFNVE